MKKKRKTLIVIGVAIMIILCIVAGISINNRIQEQKAAEEQAARFEYERKCNELLFCETQVDDSTIMIEIPNDVAVYSESNLLNEIGQLHAGEIVQRQQRLYDGECAIIWENQTAWIDTTLFVEPQNTFEYIDKTMYVCPDSIQLQSVNRAAPQAAEIQYQEAVQIIAIREDGVYKALIEDVEYFIDSEYLADEMPIVWTEQESMMYVGPFEGMNLFDNCYGTGEPVQHIEWAEKVNLLAIGTMTSQKSSSMTRNSMYKPVICLISYSPSNMKMRVAKSPSLENGMKNVGAIMYTALGSSNKRASVATETGLVTDTFKFYNSTLVNNGYNIANPGNGTRAQRTFMGTTGNPGDMYVVVSEGRYADGESRGLRKYECATLLIQLGCTYGVMLDGGGSSTMYFNGKVLNSVAGNERPVVDFVYLRKCLFE